MLQTEYVFNIMLGISEYLLFTEIFQLYHDENKLIFNEMKMRSQQAYFFLFMIYIYIYIYLKNDIGVHFFFY